MLHARAGCCHRRRHNAALSSHALFFFFFFLRSFPILRRLCLQRSSSFARITSTISCPRSKRYVLWPSLWAYLWALSMRAPLRREREIRTPSNSSLALCHSRALTPSLPHARARHARGLLTTFSSFPPPDLRRSHCARVTLRTLFPSGTPSSSTFRRRLCSSSFSPQTSSTSSRCWTSPVARLQA